MRDASFSASRFEDFPEERPAQKRRGPAPAAEPAPTPGRGARKKPSVLARVFAPRRMGMLVLLGIGGLAFVGVPMNALFLQDGHHPAPLFAARAPAPQKAAPADAPAQPPRPAQIEAVRAQSDAARPEAAPAPAKAAKTDAAALKDVIMKSEAAPVARPEKKREAASRDPIAAMLGGGEAAAKPKPQQHAQAQTQASGAGVVSAQRALQRLGYVVKPDGLMSGGTRQAIEKFEKDNGLPAKGELTPRIAKLIATRAAAPRQ